MNAPLYADLQAAPFLRRIVIVWRAAALTWLSYHRLLAHGDTSVITFVHLTNSCSSWLRPQM